MAKNYVYRMDHDRGFAPNTKYGICTLSGCKNKKTKDGKRNIEELAEKGSWISGIGGNKTGKPDKLVYAMEVEENLLYPEFKKRYPEKSKYLSSKKAGSNVLISRKFYYFGDNAIDLPQSLEHIIIQRQGCKCISDDDVNSLKKYLEERYGYGIWGKPNNIKFSKRCGKC